MHSNAALSPLIHLAFDPELREEVGKMFGCHGNPQRSSAVQPEVAVVSPNPIKIKSIKDLSQDSSNSANELEIRNTKVTFEDETKNNGVAMETSSNDK